MTTTRWWPPCSSGGSPANAPGDIAFRRGSLRCPRVGQRCVTSLSTVYFVPPVQRTLGVRVVDAVYHCDDHLLRMEIVEMTSPEIVEARFDETGLANAIEALFSLYSDPYVAALREYVANALDAHREAGTDA